MTTQISIFLSSMEALLGCLCDALFLSPHSSCREPSYFQPKFNIVPTLVHLPPYQHQLQSLSSKTEHYLPLHHR